MRPELLTAYPKPRADERPALLLPDVTLLAVTSVAVPQTVRALTLSMAQAQFAGAILLTDQPPPTAAPAGIVWEPIVPIRSRIAYSRFMLQHLRPYVRTSHVLCLQWDGYVLDGRRWNPAFLDYDYIGAPWPHFDDGHTVGNGGFSLRSARLLDACVALGIDGPSEDVAICRTHRTALKRDFGIRFAPEALARSFSFERYAATGTEFGFHGIFNLVDLVDDSDLTTLLEEIDPGVINRREHFELIRFALRRGRLALARVILRRILHRNARHH